MSIFPFASLIRRFLLHKVENQEEQPGTEASEEEVQQTECTVENEQSVEHPLTLLPDNNPKASEVGSDESFSFLFSSGHNIEEFSLVDHSLEFDAIDTKWTFTEDSGADYSLSFATALFSGLVGQADHSLSSIVLGGQSNEGFSQLHSRSSNHYHPDSDPTVISFQRESSQVVEGTPLIASNEHAFEIEQDGGTSGAAEVVGEARSGEILNDGSVDHIYFYDGEPINLGAPVILDPIGEIVSTHPDDGGGGPTQAFPIRGHGIALKNASEQGAVLTFDAERDDGRLDFDLAEFHSGDTIQINNFAMGRDTLRIKTLFGIEETLETLQDNSPAGTVGKEGEAILAFSVERAIGEECTVSFVGLTYDEYMEFLSAAMHKVIES